MTNPGPALGRPPRASRPPAAAWPPRRRKRWLAAAGLAGCWAVLLYLTGSLVGGTALLLLLAALAAGCALSLRYLGVGPGHPWAMRLASRPWRDGQDVLRLSMRHLPEVFVTTPGGSLLAPNAVELRLNPGDLASLAEVIDLGLAASSAAEVYAEQVAAHGARFTGSGPAQVRITGDPAVPAGRYRLRQGRPLPARSRPVPGGPWPVPADPWLGPDGPPAGPWPVPASLPDGSFAPARDGRTCTEATLAPPVIGTATAGALTVAAPAAPAIPLLRLVTGDRVAQTATSGAVAGRGAVDLVLPRVATISREHARFTFAAGRWWVTNLGRNGLTLNGVPLAGRHVLADGDSIRWGRTPDVPVSRVEITKT